MSWFWKSVRFEDATGSAVAKVVSAKFNGVSDESAKLMLENDTPPEETSGTFPMVVVVVEQVTSSMMESTASWTSATSAVVPTTKQAVARLSLGALVVGTRYFN